MEYLASYVSQNTKYNITRYVYENRSPIKEKNSLFGLTELEQREKMSKMMELDQEELFTKFDSIYFSLRDNKLQDEYAIYYIEKYIMTDEKRLNFDFPYFAFNNKCRKILAERYLNGCYDKILNTVNKTYLFDSKFSLKPEYVKVSEYTNKRFPLY